ncbi:ubiquitin-like protein ISG15 [Periophthalmus magnuspinnatus]|uniref:ubiquitin-like protein ISG15 n=1 Tax=Periophthalmus magnuspinnatus TaxID=409849 RepID=UPI00145BB1A4|nr:ubiquitin-like protein ISG15 [Periophthalmus magnuspinnatus]
MMDITITMLNGECRTLTVNPGDSVSSLKRLIQSHLQVAPECQRLTISNGQNKVLSDNSKPLSYYGLVPGSKVSLLVVEPTPVQVFLKNEKGQTSTYDMDPGETVQSFKRKVHARERVPVDQQRLIYQGKEMMDGKLTDYGVEALGTIYLTLRLRGG